MEGQHMALTGGCACGRVRYQINDEPMFTYACHCTDCQRTTGSAFVLHSVIAKDEFEIKGNTRATTLPTGSAAGYDLHFCSECGTYIWCKYHVTKVAVITVRAGTLDDTGKVRPQAHIFTRSLQPWLALPEDVPSFAEGYDRSKVWPADSLKKFNRMAGSD
jgi:hypothetical protein